MLCFLAELPCLLTIIIIIIIIINYFIYLLLLLLLLANHSLIKKKVCQSDNKYFSPLKQHSIISHLSYQCYKNVSIKNISLLSVRFVSVNIGCKKYI